MKKAKKKKVAKKSPKAKGKKKLKKKAAKSFKSKKKIKKITAKSRRRSRDRVTTFDETLDEFLSLEDESMFTNDLKPESFSIDEFGIY